MNYSRLAASILMAVTMGCTHTPKVAKFDQPVIMKRAISSTTETDAVESGNVVRQLPTHDVFAPTPQFAKLSDIKTADKFKNDVYGLNSKLIAANPNAGETPAFMNNPNAFATEKVAAADVPGNNSENRSYKSSVAAGAGDARPHMMALSKFTKAVPQAKTANIGQNRAYTSTFMTEAESRKKVMNAKVKTQSKRTPQQVSGCLATTEDSYENNDSRTSAYDLSGSEGRWLSSVWGRGVQFDPDWYKITVSDSYRNLIVDLRYTYSCADIDLDLYDVNGNLIAQSDDANNDEYISLTLARGGVYYIAVYFSNKGSYYDLKWSTSYSGGTVIADDSYESNDYYSNGYDLRGWEGRWLSSLYGSGVSKNVDYYKIYVDQGYLKVTLDLRFQHSAGDLELYLLNSNGSQVASSTSSDNDEYISYTVPGPGIYYVKVDSYSSYYATTYDLKWFLTQTGPVWTEDGYEHNDSRSAATQISINQQVNANQFDEDWYRFTVADNARQIQLTMNHENDDGDIDIRLYDSNGFELGSSIGYSDREYIDRTVSGAGTYYVKVYGDNKGNPYNVTVRSFATAPSDDSYEPNDTMAMAYDLTGRGGIWLQNIAGLGYQKNQDFYKIYVPAELRHLYVDLRFAASQGNLDLELLDASGRSMMYARSNSDNEQIDLLMENAPGFYYIRVVGADRSQSYDLKWIARPINLPTPPPDGKINMVEYYNPFFKHYFITGIPDEVNLLDQGKASWNWHRTGYTYLAYPNQAQGTLGACRFFAFTSDGTPHTAFHTVSPSECDYVKQNMSQYYIYNGIAFYMAPPAGDGSCPANSTSIYRMYNNGKDGLGNHRYISNLDERQILEASGWVFEAPVMCSPNY